MAALYLFTWNLKKQAAAHKLAVDHLALRGTRGLFIACIQELPGKSDIAKARTRKTNPSLSSSGIEVVSGSAFSANARGRNLPAGLALAHHPDLRVLDAIPDEDGEFLAARFELRSPKKTIGVVGLHLKSKVDMQSDEDRGGSRALLRHAINELRWSCDHTVILGDWNSALSAREMQSWHCFYALREGYRVLAKPSLAQRRGVDHPPLYVVQPRNAAMGTFRFHDSGADSAELIDFIVVDKGSLPGSSSEILTTVAATPVWDALLAAPSVSDHLPVEGHLQV